MSVGIDKTIIETGTLVAVDTACAASGAYTASSIINCTGWSWITLLCNIAGAAAGGFPSLVFRGSVNATAPLFGDDVWYPISISNGTPTATLGTGTRVSGVDYTNSPEQNRLVVMPLEIVSQPHDGATDEIRMALPPIRLGWAKWFSLEFAEDGVTGTPCSIGIEYVLHNG